MMTTAFKPRLAFAVLCVAAMAIVVVASLLAPATEVTRAGLTDSTVVARLQRAQAPLSAALITAMRASRAAPADPVLARAAARIMIEQGRDLGDSRIVGAASGILRPFLATGDAETLYLSATARQYQHDFNGALDLLDRAIAIDPRGINARLSRATIYTVLGRLDDALVECGTLSGLRPDVGFLCQSTALILTDQAPVVATRLAQILAQPGMLPDSLRPWAIGLQGEIAALQGDDPAALSYFNGVIAADQTVIRERLLAADVLLRLSRPQGVIDILADAPPVDGVLLRQVLALRALNDTAAAAPLETELARRVTLNLDLGLTSHAREDGLYFLLIAADPAAALERAQVNWALQHEIEDARLLIDAATAAGQPEAAAPVADWIAAQHIVVPTLHLPAGVAPELGPEPGPVSP